MAEEEDYDTAARRREEEEERRSTLSESERIRDSRKTASEVLRETYEKARESLEKRAAELDEAFGEEQYELRNKILSLTDEQESLESDIEDIESKIKATEKLIEESGAKTLSWNQLNTAFKKIWNTEVPGYPKFKSSDNEETKEKIKSERKQLGTLTRGPLRSALDDQIKSAARELTDDRSKIEAIKTEVAPIKQQVAQWDETTRGGDTERGDLTSRIQSWDENVTDEEALEWLWDNGFRDEAKAVGELDRTVTREEDFTEVKFEGSREGRLPLKNKIDQLERRDQIEARQPGPGELDVEPASAGEELSESERIREGLEGIPLRTDEPRDPMQIGLEEGLAAQRERQAQERDRRGQARVTDPRQVVPEFGPGTTKDSDDGGGDPEPEGLDEDTRQYIIDNFSLAGFLLQLPDGELSAEREIPPGSGNMVQIDNVMAYINENGLTNTDEIRSLFLQTQWYNNTEPERRKWQSQWYGEGGKVNQTWADSNANQRALLDDEMDKIRREAGRLGLDLTDEQLWSLAFEAKSMGFDTYEIREKFLETYDQAILNYEKGRIETYRNDIRDEAAEYMDTWTQTDLDDAAKRVYLGETTIEEIEAGIRTEAKAANPALASLIDQGYTPKMYFASYKKEAEDLLERNVDFLGGDRGLYNQLIGTDWSSDGMARPMTRAEFGRTLRSTPEWQYTDNARDSAYDAASQIARMFGGIG